MKLLRNIYYYILSFVLIYLYIYAPAFQFMPIGFDKIILLLSYFYLIKKRVLLKHISIFKTEYFFIIIALIYCVLLLPFSNSIDYFRNEFVALIEIIVVPFALFIYFKDERFSLESVMLTCSIIAAFITVFLLVNPEIAQNLKANVLKYPEHLVERFLFRGYGLSDGLLFSYPVVQGFCLSFIILGIRRNILFSIFSIPIFISVICNARSGLFPIFIAFILLLISNKKLLYKNITLILCVVFVFFGTLMAFLNDNQMLLTAFEWGLTSFDIIGDLLQGEKSENFDVLLGNMLIFPETFGEWIFGRGQYLYAKNNIGSTDIGYLLRLNYGGLIYLGIQCFMLLYMFVRLFNINKTISLLMFGALTYLNFKGDFFIVNTASRFFFFVYIVTLLNHKYCLKKEVMFNNIK